MTDLGDFTAGAEKLSTEWKQTGRDRGFLTEADRKFLYGSRELEGQQARNARYRIRQRTIEGLQDIAFVNKHLDRFTDDRRQIANEERISRLVTEALVAFSYKMILDNHDTPDPIERLEDDIESAVLDAHPFSDNSLESQDDSKNNVRMERTVDVHIEVENTVVTHKDMEDRIRDGSATIIGMDQYVSSIGDDYEIPEDVRKKIIERAKEMEALTKSVGDED